MISVFIYFFLGYLNYDSGQVPVGQLEPDEELPDFAAKVEKIFSVSLEPHFSQVWVLLLPAFSRNEVTWPHFLH